MSPIETLWALTPIVIVLAGLLAFIRKRSKTADFAESRASKEALPGWVKNVESLNFVALFSLLTIFTFKTFEVLDGPYRSANWASGAAAVYLVLGIVGITIPISFIGANVLSWAVPALRNANQRAFRGHRVSFTSANAGLAQFASVSVPLGVVALCIAAITPWVHR